MLRKYLLGISMFISLILFVTACTNKPVTIEEAMNKAGILYDSIVYTKEKDNVSIVFYTDRDILGLGLLNKVKEDWAWGLGITDR